MLTHLYSQFLITGKYWLFLHMVMSWTKAGIKLLASGSWYKNGAWDMIVYSPVKSILDSAYRVLLWQLWTTETKSGVLMEFLPGSFFILTILISYSFHFNNTRSEKLVPYWILLILKTCALLNSPNTENLWFLLRSYFILTILTVKDLGFHWNTRLAASGVFLC